MSADFFNEANERKTAATSVSSSGAAGVERGDGMSESGVAKLSRQRGEMTDSMVGAAEEIERLRLRQEELEKERRELEELSSKQSDYERTKKEIVEKLQKSIIWIEKEEQQAQRMVEIFGETRARFRTTLAQLTSIDESGWGTDAFESELNKALVTVDLATTDCNKALSRIEAASWHKDPVGGERGTMMDALGRGMSQDRGFVQWLKIGLALSLPMIVLFLLWEAVSFVLNRY